MTNIFSEYTIRPIERAEWPRLHFIWESSQEADDPAGRPANGWWFWGDWTETGLVLSNATTYLGLAAYKPTTNPAAVEVRLAVLPEFRQPEVVKLLVEAVFEIARQDGF